MCKPHHTNSAVNQFSHFNNTHILYQVTHMWLFTCANGLRTQQSGFAKPQVWAISHKGGLQNCGQKFTKWELKSVGGVCKLIEHLWTLILHSNQMGAPSHRDQSLVDHCREDSHDGPRCVKRLVSIEANTIQFCMSLYGEMRNHSLSSSTLSFIIVTENESYPLIFPQKY